MGERGIPDENLCVGAETRVDVSVDWHEFQVDENKTCSRTFSSINSEATNPHVTKCYTGGMNQRHCHRELDTTLCL